jgi:TonB-dependent SusC/RagA subfamily outer membrane receptor
MKQLLTLLSLIVITSTQAQQNFEKLWTKVEVFEVEGKTKSASEIVEKIYKKATSKNNSNQLIKSLVYQSKFALVLQEDAELQIVTRLKKEISKTQEISTKAILQSILADFKWQYLQQHRWQIYNRTKTTEVINSDLRTWDLNTLFTSIYSDFKHSIENRSLLQKEVISNFNYILIKGSETEKLRPTLYDLLAHRALVFFKSNESRITKPKNRFYIDNDAYFSTSKEFSELNIETTDSMFSQFEVLKTYQNLEKFHLKANNTEGYIDVYIDRLNFVKNQFTNHNKRDELCIASLKKTASKLPKGNSYATVNAHYAQAIYNISSLKKHPENRKKALDICNTIIKNYPKSEGFSLATNLKNTILHPTIHIKNEDIVPLNTPSKVLVTYQNTSQIHFSIYKVDYDHNFYQYNYSKRDSVMNHVFKTNKPIKEFTQQLPQKNDYFNHSTEVIIPKLSNGKYIILVTKDSTKNTTETFSYNYQLVSNLSYVESYFHGETTLQVLDRMSGKPIENAKVQLGKIIKHTDANGDVSYSRKINHDATITYQNDTLDIGKIYSNNYYKKPAKQKAKTQGFLFLDRSIYRPGQEVYFKGIILERKNFKSTVVSNETYNVVIKDANHQDIKSFELTTNEFGSFSENFKLPKNGLTGQFSIKIELLKKSRTKNFNGGHSYFSVEEYKRPKFEVVFKPITESYLVNQNICIKGNAKALAGSNITDAKVTYRVVRKTQYSHWRYWSSYTQSEQQEIAQGNITTNDKGEFDINFNALPDVTSDKNGLPIFSYEITADVTDVNGETRSNTTTVKVGYHSMTLAINTPEQWNTTSENAITINTANLNDEFSPAEITVQIYKLKAPSHILRTRKWQAPDMPLLSEEEFHKLFPYDAYSNEDAIKNWEKGALVFEDTINTKDKTTLEFKHQDWVSGNYVIVAKGTDAFDITIEQEKRIVLTNTNDTYLADQQLLNYEILNKTTARTDGFVILKLRTADKNLYVQTEAYCNSNQVYKENVLVNGTKTLQIPIQNSRKKNTLLPNSKLDILFSIVRFNEHINERIWVSLAEKTESLTIEAKTFRDKLQPGTTEKWSFTIKDVNGAVAEILASMYDTSLDLFKPHSWKNNITIFDYSNYNDVANKDSYGFDTSGFYLRNNTYIKSNYMSKTFSKINHFGFSLTNTNAVRREYHNYLYSKIKKTGDEKFISGSVVDETNMPLPGATVVIRGTTNGTSTDFDGLYSIKAKTGDVLTFSYVGFADQTLIVQKSNTINAKLTLDNSLEEVVVSALGVKRKSNKITSAQQVVKNEQLTQANNPDVIAGISSDTQIILRGNRSVSVSNKALIVIDGKICSEDALKNLNPNSITDTNVLKGANGAALYGSQGANGVIIVTTDGSNIAFDKIIPRKNLKETAFFYPHLKTNSKGDVSFEFETPEALTRWKVQLFGHTKTGVSGKFTQNVVTQKELMVTPNPPRFLRERDTIIFQTKISNLSNKSLNGFAKLELYDAITGKEINTELQNNAAIQNFNISTKGNTSVSWKLAIPEGIQAIEYNILAKAGDFTDGESNVLPVLKNSMLVTESIPITVRSNSSKSYSFNTLKNNTSTTLRNHQLTLEYTSNPAWYAIQSLPYLMEFPHECAEQTFSRYYANSIGSLILNSNPKIKTVFDSWKANGQLTSKLEQNEELKQVLISETPWIRDAQSDTEKKKRLGLLFDIEKLASDEKSILKKLAQMQLYSGGFPWFNGGKANEYITRYIVAGFGHLQQLGVADISDKNKTIIGKAVNYLDVKFIENHNRKLEYQTLEDISVGNYELHYLYARSFFKNTIPFDKTIKPIVNSYINKAKKNWLNRSLLQKTMLSMVLHRFNDRQLPQLILEHLKETSITDEEKGMYWKSNTSGWYWHEAPIETQALIIEAFSEITDDKNTIEELQIWLLNNKRKNDWNTTKATTEAIYALLLQGNDWLSIEGSAKINIGGDKIDTKKLEQTKVEAGTGYFKTTWHSDEITTKMADISVKNTSDVTQFGGYYWQYFEQLDKITNEDHKNDIQLHKELFLKKNTNNGTTLTKIENAILKIGDLVTIRIELQVKDNFEFVHLKDMRASAFEPVNVISKYKWQDGTGYYQSTKDVATHFFFDNLSKGTYVLEYDVRMNNAGDFSNGISTIQSMYAPEFSSHSKGVRVSVKEN